MKSELLKEIKEKLILQITGELHKQMNTTGLVRETLKAAEEKFNRRIEKTLREGVALRISLTDEGVTHDG